MIYVPLRNEVEKLFNVRRVSDKHANFCDLSLNYLPMLKIPVFVQSNNLNATVKYKRTSKLRTKKIMKKKGTSNFFLKIRKISFIFSLNCL